MIKKEVVVCPGRACTHPGYEEAIACCWKESDLKSSERKKEIFALFQFFECCSLSNLSATGIDYLLE